MQASFVFLISRAYIKYYLQVSTDIENQNSWKECFKVSGIRLPIGYYFGASAATGDLAGKVFWTYEKPTENSW